MKNIFVHNHLFRTIVPLFYGILVYILILLIFDSITQLTENFFSFEVLVCVVISYFLSELMRVVIHILDRTCSDKSISYRILLQFLVNAGTAILITSLIITLYFTYLVGFKSFRTELLVFNSIYLISSIFYNAMYFSIYYLNKTNEIKLEREKSLKDKTIAELQDYKNKINPEFLYSSLETLISLSRKDVDKADDFINNLSQVYRSILSSKRNEVVPAEKDIHIANNLISILNYKYHHNISLQIKNEIKGNIIPGTLIFILQRIVKNSIISEIQPLEIIIECKNEHMEVSHLMKDKIITDLQHGIELENLQKAYGFISNDTLTIKEENKHRYYIIPTIKMIENESINH